MTPNPLDDSRLFWIHQHKPNTGYVNSIDNLTFFLYKSYFKRNEVLTKKHLWLFLRDLAVNWLQSDTQFLAINRNKNAYSPGRIYHQLDIKYNATAKVIKALRADGMILLRRGFKDWVTGVGYVTRFKATDKLIELFEGFDVRKDIDAVYPVSRPLNVLEVRDISKRPISYVPTHQVKVMIDEVAKYNDALEDVYVDVCLDGYQYPVKIDLTKKFVRRIFNNNTIEQGGRLAGAWWLDCPSDVRSRILLGHLETVEFDLKALHPALLYAQQGIDYFVESGADPYEVCDVEAILNRRLHDAERGIFRKVFKQIFLVLINNVNEGVAKKAFWNEVRLANSKARREGRSLPYPDQMPSEHLTLLWDAFKEAHAAIAGHFAGSGSSIPASMRLMRIDSDFIMRVLMSMLDEGVVCLSVHDSLIVPFPHQALAERVLQETFRVVLVEHGIRPVGARPVKDEFYKVFTPWAKESFINDQALKYRAALKRPQYLNYFPATPV